MDHETEKLWRGICNAILLGAVLWAFVFFAISRARAAEPIRLTDVQVHVHWSTPDQIACAILDRS